jgi:cobaltochelatase CobS
MQERTFTVAKAAEVFNISAPDAVVVNVFDTATAFVPEVDPAYVFEREALKNVLLWLEGDVSKNLLVQGPTGCGKSSLVEQVCARLNIEVWRVACHSKLEFAEMLGSMTLVPGAMKAQDGLLSKASAALKSIFKGADEGENLLEWLARSLSSGVVTRFQDGPAVTAARRGGVLLMDEGNFLPPSTFGAFNTLLDGGALLVPETGEAVTPHPAFRIVMTGNAVNDDDATVYRGIQRMSVALIHRFLTMRADYMPAVQEAQIIAKTVPLSSHLIEAMLTVAGETRAAFKAAVIETTISTRIMVRWAKLIHKRRGALGTAKQSDAIAEALRFALLDGANRTDAKAVETILNKTIHGRDFGYGKSASGATKAADPQPVDPATSSAQAANAAPLGTQKSTVSLLVHANGGAPKVWAVIETADLTSGVAVAHTLMYGGLGKTLSSKSVDMNYLFHKRPEKIQKGYVSCGPLVLKHGLTIVASFPEFMEMVAKKRMGSKVTFSNAEETVCNEILQAIRT